MYLQKVISKKTQGKKYFVAVLKFTDENIRIRIHIRIHQSEVRIRTTPKFHESATLQQSRRFFLSVFFINTVYINFNNTDSLYFTPAHSRVISNPVHLTKTIFFFPTLRAHGYSCTVYCEPQGRVPRRKNNEVDAQRRHLKKTF